MPTPPPYAAAAQDALMTGQLLTGERRLAQFEPEALVAALLDDPDGPAAGVLRRLALDPVAMRRDAEQALDLLPTLQYGTEVSIASNRLRTVLSRAEADAARTGEGEVGVGHLLVGVLLAGDSVTARRLAERGVIADAIRRAARERAAVASPTTPAASPTPDTGIGLHTAGAAPAAIPGPAPGAPVMPAPVPTPSGERPATVPGAANDPLASRAVALLAESLRVTEAAVAVVAAHLGPAPAADADADRLQAAALWLAHAPALLDRLDRLARR